MKRRVKKQKSRPSLWRRVKDLNADGELAIFVGAGISMSCGLPSWKVLVERVLNEVWKHEPDTASLLSRDRNLLATRYARQKADKQFARIVGDCLYRDEIKISKCVWAIARSGTKRICTFNFDDLLEEALRTDGTDAVIVTPDDSIHIGQPKLTVYHPHGILPRFYHNNDTEISNIVFSEDDYHNLYSDPYSLANVAQVSLLTGYSVLFVGLSMQDPNLRRLIDITRRRGFRNQHFAVFRDPTKDCPAENLAEQKQLRRLIEIDMQSLGVTPWFVDSYDKLADILEAIAATTKKRGRYPIPR